MTPAEQQAAAAAAAHAAFLILLETRLEFAFASLFTGLRLFCRWKNGGFRSWWWDDFFAVKAWVWYAVMEAAIELVGKGIVATIRRHLLISCSPMGCSLWHG